MPRTSSCRCTITRLPPGSGQTVHYRLHVPADVTAPGEGRAGAEVPQVRQGVSGNRGQIHEQKNLGRCATSEPGEPYANELPVTVLARDEMVFPVEGVDVAVTNAPRDIPPWQRWNDYGIGMLLKGKAELRQAAEAFAAVEKLNRFDGPLNLARVYYREGRLDEAVDALRRAAACQDPPAPPWTMAWLSGLVNREQGHLAEAERNLRSVLEDKTPEMLRRGFDFSRDYVVINELGLTLFTRAQQTLGERRKAERESLLQQAAAQFEKTLTLDSEDVTAHHNLALIYAQLGDAGQGRRTSATASALQGRRQCARSGHCLGAPALSGGQSRGRSAGDLSAHQRGPSAGGRTGSSTSNDHTSRRSEARHDTDSRNSPMFPAGNAATAAPFAAPWSSSACWRRSSWRP